MNTLEYTLFRQEHINSPYFYLLPNEYVPEVFEIASRGKQSEFVALETEFREMEDKYVITDSVNDELKVRVGDLEARLKDAIIFLQKRSNKADREEMAKFLTKGLVQ